MFEGYAKRLNRRADGNLTRWEKFTGVCTPRKETGYDRAYIARLNRRIENARTPLDTLHDVTLSVVSVGYEIKPHGLEVRFYERQAVSSHLDFLDYVYLTYSRYLPNVIGFIPETISAVYGNIHNRISTAILTGKKKHLFETSK